jgi:uncharacterized membrane protein YkvA (DUF1232 family)
MSDTKVPKDTRSYQKHYSESDFWEKAKSLGKKVLKPALTLYYVMQSSDTPFHIKTAIIGALGYLILPTDIIPDFIPVAGYTDDFAALMAIIKMCKDYITKDIEQQVKNKLEE